MYNIYHITYSTYCPEENVYMPDTEYICAPDEQTAISILRECEAEAIRIEQIISLS